MYQAVCSPFRNPLDRHERVTVRAGDSPAAGRIAHLLARARHACPDPESGGASSSQPTFDNQFATLELAGRAALLKIERTVPSDRPDGHTIETSLERRLA